MTLTHGADAGALATSAGRLDRLAARLGEQRRELDGSARALLRVWVGPDAQRFTGSAARPGRGLDDVARGTRALATALRREIDAQDRTSDGSGLPLPSAGPVPALRDDGPPTPSSPGVPPRPLDDLAPPSGADPGGVAQWWDGLSEAEQALLVDERPEWIGNLDGVDAADRDAANRARIPELRAELEARREALAQGTDDAIADWLGLGEDYRDLQEREGAVETWLSGDPTSTEEIDGQLAALGAIELVLDRGDRQLLELDPSRARMEAAVAIGDVQTADHVVVFTPGLTSTVERSLDGYDDSMDDLRVAAQQDLAMAGRGSESVAAVTYIGYQAPQLDGSVVLGGERSVASNAMAREGGRQLATFDEGLVAARGSDTHLTKLGHSYGSTATSSAVQRTDVVDDVVLFGPPGPDAGWVDFFEDQTPDHGLGPDHVYVLENDGDLVADLGAFGRDPSTDADSYTHLSTGDSTFGHRTTGHSSYLEDRSTSQHNMLQVVIGGRDTVGR